MSRSGLRQIREKNIWASPVRSQNIFNDFHLFVFIASSLSHVRRWFYLCNSEYQNIRRNISLPNNIFHLPSLTSETAWQINSLIHFKENHLVVVDFVYKVPFCYNTWSIEFPFLNSQHLVERLKTKVRCRWYHYHDLNINRVIKWEMLGGRNWFFVEEKFMLLTITIKEVKNPLSQIFNLPQTFSV